MGLTEFAKEDCFEIPEASLDLCGQQVLQMQLCCQSEKAQQFK